MPDSVVRQINDWVKRSNREEYGKKMPFLNITRVKYDWGSYEFEEYEGLVDYDIPHSDISM